jgi:hypothetical protein
MASHREEVVIALGGKDEGAGTLLEKTVQRIRAVKAETRASGEKDLKKLLGGGLEGLADFGLKATGLGVVGLIADQAAQAVGEAFNKAAEFRKEVEEGKRSWSEMPGEIAKTLPVIGSVASAGESIIEFFTRSKEGMEELNKRAEEHYEKVVKQTEAYKHLKEVIHDLHEDSAKLTLDIVGTEYERRLTAIDEHLQGQLEKIEKARNEAKTLGKVERDKKLQELQKEEMDARGTASLRRSKAEAELGQKYDEAQLAAEQQLADAKAEIQERAMRDAGRYLDADIAAAVRAGEAKKRALEKQAQADNLASGGVGDPAARMRLLEKQKAAQDLATQQEIDRLKQQARLDDSRAASELRQKELAAAGQDLEAQLEQIRESYAERIAAAKTQAQREALIREEAIDEQVARKKAQEQAAKEAQSAAEGKVAPARRAIEALLLGNGFTGIAERQRATSDPELVRANVYLAGMAKDISKIAGAASGRPDAPTTPIKGYVLKL